MFGETWQQQWQTAFHVLLQFKKTAASSRFWFHDVLLFLLCCAGVSVVFNEPQLAKAYFLFLWPSPHLVWPKGHKLSFVRKTSEIVTLILRRKGVLRECAKWRHFGRCDVIGLASFSLAWSSFIFVDLEFFLRNSNFILQSFESLWKKRRPQKFYCTQQRFVLCDFELSEQPESRVLSNLPLYIRLEPTKVLGQNGFWCQRITLEVTLTFLMFLRCRRWRRVNATRAYLQR